MAYKIEITKRAKFTVESSEVDSYGNLIVTSKKGNTYKIGGKREPLFSTFQPDVEVIIGYAMYNNREYIAEATQAEQVVSTNTPVEAEPEPKTTPKATTPPKTEPEFDKNTSIIKQTCLKCAAEIEARKDNSERSSKDIAASLIAIANILVAWATSTQEIVKQIEAVIPKKK